VMSALFIFVLALTMHQSHCYSPSRAEIEAHYKQTPGAEPFGSLYALTSNNVEFYVGGSQEPIKGKSTVLNMVRAFPVTSQDSHILSIIIEGKIATVHRHTQIVGKAGCIAQQKSLDMLTFNDEGKIEKFEWYPDRPVELIVAEANCKGTFTPEEIHELLTEDDGKKLSWNRETLVSAFTDDIEVVLPGGHVVRGLEPAISFSLSLGYKSFVVITEDIFVVPKTNNLLLKRSTHFTTTTNCVFHQESLVKVELSWPDGKFKRWELVVSTGNEKESCPSKKEKKGEL